jgi:glucan phosphoethanolaminetransferase (alkaline phosphatase superfamily)
VPGPFEYSIWFLGALFEAAVVVCSLLRGPFRRYFTLNLYMSVSFLVSVGRYLVLVRHDNNVLSSAYVYFYYYSDAILTICLFFALMGLYAIVFEELGAAMYLRVFMMLMLIGTTLFSYSVVRQSEARMLTHYIVEISQNLYFVGLVLTYVLWAALLKLHESRVRVIQIVLSLGVYFSINAANYALHNAYPNLRIIWEYLPPMAGMLLPVAWMYAFIRFDENARLAPSRLAAVPR